LERGLERGGDFLLIDVLTPNRDIGFNKSRDSGRIFFGRTKDTRQSKPRNNNKVNELLLLDAGETGVNFNRAQIFWESGIHNSARPNGDA
jgi:hypothetical protein